MNIVHHRQSMRFCAYEIKRFHSNIWSCPPDTPLNKYHFEIMTTAFTEEQGELGEIAAMKTCIIVPYAAEIIHGDLCKIWSSNIATFEQ